MNHMEFYPFPAIPNDFDAVVGVMRDAFAPWDDGLTLTYTQCAATHVRCELRADTTSAVLGAFEVWKDIEEGQPGITIQFEDPPQPKRQRATQEEGDRITALPTFEERAGAWRAQDQQERAEQKAQHTQQKAWWNDYVRGRMPDAYTRLGVFKHPQRHLLIGNPGTRGERLCFDSYCEHPVSRKFSVCDARFDEYIPNWHNYIAWERHEVNRGHIRYILSERGGDGLAWVELYDDDSPHTMVGIDLAPVGCFGGNSFADVFAPWRALVQRIVTTWFAEIQQNDNAQQAREQDSTARQLMRVFHPIALLLADADRVCAQRLECPPYRYQRRQIDDAARCGVVYDVVQHGADVGQVYLWGKTADTTEVWVKSAPVNGTNDEQRAAELDTFSTDVQRWFSTALILQQSVNDRAHPSQSPSSTDTVLSEELQTAQKFLDTYKREQRQGLVHNQEEWMRRHGISCDRSTLYRWVKKLEKMQQNVQH